VDGCSFPKHREGGVEIVGGAMNGNSGPGAVKRACNGLPDPRRRTSDKSATSLKVDHPARMSHLRMLQNTVPIALDDNAVATDASSHTSDASRSVDVLDYVDT